MDAQTSGGKYISVSGGRILMKVTSYKEITIHIIKAGENIRLWREGRKCRRVAPPCTGKLTPER
ncbi:hypothetical protein [Superficieibacter sp.]|uniref:hypothetical protein n=1 Tax=Superficieibacter sp. TaxID=2303322 RepID=UPI0028ADE2C5|nr:hypothetical protein [Superficieibacter sp.]